MVQLLRRYAFVGASITWLVYDFIASLEDEVRFLGS